MIFTGLFWLVFGVLATFFSLIDVAIQTAP